MPTANGRGQSKDNPERTSSDRDEDLIHDEDFDPAQYDTMLLLERLESLEEEMQELGVSTLDDVRRRIAELHRELDDELR
jgi:hypothetical protein